MARVFRVAVLNLNQSQGNQSIPAIRRQMQRLADRLAPEIQLQVEILWMRVDDISPDFMAYDIFIGSGGPGNPAGEIGKPWSNRFEVFLRKLYGFNFANASEPHLQKPFYGICFSFQLAALYMGYGVTRLRPIPNFGVYPIYLKNPQGILARFPIFDSRFFEVIVDRERVRDLGGVGWAYEGPEGTQSLCAIDFSSVKFRLTQFHPEVDKLSMSVFLQSPHTMRSQVYSILQVCRTSEEVFVGWIHQRVLEWREH